MFAQGMFQIDPNATPDQVERKRAMIAALMPRFGQAKYVGEGLGQLATGIAMGAQNRKLDRAENTGRQGASDLFSRIMGGARGDTSGFSILGQGQQAASRPTDPNDPVNIAGDTMTALGKDAGTSGYRASLIGTESGGNWKAQNSEMGAGGKKGHFGRVQFGQARLQEAMNAGAIPQGTTPEQFMNSPALQIAAENWHFSDLERQLSPLVGTVVNGKPLDLGALVAMGHLGGAAGARRFVETGGRYNPSDTFGTSLADYAAKHGGLSSELSSAARPVQASTDEAAIYEALANPWLNAQQRAALTDMLGQSRQNADPMRQLEMQKLQKEVELMGQPKAPTPTDDMREYEFAKQQGFEGTFTDFMTAMRKAGASTTNINNTMGGEVGTIPQGFELFTDAETGARSMRPIAGGPEDQTQKNEKAAGGRDIATQTITSSASRAREASKNRSVDGFLAGIAAMNPESENAEIYRQVDVLKSQAIVSNLQAMRDASPTGGALGAVTAPELKMLADKSGALDPRSKNFERDLNDYELSLLQVVHGPDEGRRIFEATRSDAPTAPDEDGWQTINGYKVRVKQ